MPKINTAIIAVLALAVALVPPTPVTGTSVTVSRAAIPHGWLPLVPSPSLGGPTESMTSTETDTQSRCGDPAGEWLGMRWRGALRWRLNEQTIPGYLGDRALVVAAIRSAAATVDAGRNDCGLPEHLGLSQRYTGGTQRRAGVTHDGGCGDRDGHNTVSFGSLNPGLLAVTCVWWYGGENSGRSVEADILIDNTGGLFFLTVPTPCESRWDLEGTLTHEFGHAFGLGHVTFHEHGHLTMTDGLPGCSTGYRGLGLGDYLTLQRQYG